MGRWFVIDFNAVIPAKAGIQELKLTPAYAGVTFSEGSGKIGRLYMNSFLKQGGYDPVIIHSSERQRYYESLRDGQEPLRDFLLDNMESAIESQMKFVNGGV